MTAALSDHDLLARLVAFDTTSEHSNAPLVDFLCDYLDRPGIRLERLASPEPGKINLMARAGPEVDAQRRGLVLAGHVDCVPATEPEWTSDPFTLRERDGRWLARGSCDMKGFDALAANLLIDAASGPLAAQVALLLTHDEEVGSLGVKALIDRGLPPLPRSVVIGEPTSLRAVRMHKGHLKMRITATGTAAHSGSPHLGANAIDRITPVLAALVAYGHSLRDQRTETSDWFPTVPFPVFNVCRIRGGVALNVIPESCIIELGIRALPGSDTGAYMDAVREVVAAHGMESVTTTLINDNPPMLTADDAPLHRELCELLGQTESHGVSFASDGGLLNTCGHECVLFGPGDIAQAHRPDEFVPITEMNAAASTLRQLVAQMCGG